MCLYQWVGGFWKTRIDGFTRTICMGGAAFQKKWGLMLKKAGKRIPEFRNNGLSEPKKLNQKVPG